MKKIFSLGVLVLSFAFVGKAEAVVQSLNGLTGQAQTFANDTNITINSSGTTHTLGWSGILQPSRGGTGVNMSTFSAGSILFFNGTSIAENGGLLWDNINNKLNLDGSILGTNINNFVIGSVSEMTLDAQTHLSLTSGDGVDAGNITLIAGDTTNTSGSEIHIYAGSSSVSDGGYVSIQAGQAGGNGNGGSITLSTTQGSGSGQDGYIIFENGRGGSVVLDHNQVSEGGFFTFPDANGTFALVENSQTWTGLNLFEANTNSTIYVGSSVKSGCIALGDSDGTGITYVTANDGVLSSSSTKPNICQ